MVLLKLLIATLLLVLSGSDAGPTYLRADGKSVNAYNIIKNALGGGAYEVSDNCHRVAHITQRNDSELGTPVFNFALHAKSDNDRCQSGIKDRQRTEIKVDKNSNEYLKCLNGQSVSYSWDVHLDVKFQPSMAFTHIFQIKAVGKEASKPFITITPKIKSNKRVLQIIHSGKNSKRDNTVFEDDLSKYTGRWVHVTVKYTCKVGGSINIRMRPTQQPTQQIMDYKNDTIDLWRSGNGFLRPKWGIYRSLNNRNNLRDENVYFNNFCIGKGGGELCN